MSRLERGERRPSSLVIGALARALNVDPDWLASGRGTTRSELAARQGSTVSHAPNWSAIDKLLEEELTVAEVRELPRHSFDRYVRRLDRIRREADEEIQAKLNEITRRIHRELADFRKLLLAEWRAERHQGKST